MNVGIVGEWASANLGDAAIGLCLQDLLQTLGYRVTPIDLSGRMDGGDLASTAPLFGKLLRVPHWARAAKSRLVWEFSARERLRSHYESRLAECDYVLIGGGHLLNDRLLNFPRKLQLLGRCLAARRLRYSFVSCGFGSFSPAGLAMVTEVLSGADAIGLRDSESIGKLQRLLPALAEKAVIVPDPAFRSRIALGARVQDEPVGRLAARIGIGVIERTRVEPYVPSVRDWSDARYDEFWMRIVTAASRIGEVVVFSNGDPFDVEYSRKIHDHCRSTGIEAAFTAPGSIDELVATIRGVSHVIAARLHALIIAAAFDKCVIGVVWDPKVAGILHDMGCGDRAIGFDFRDDDSELIERFCRQSDPPASQRQYVRASDVELTEAVQSVLPH